MTILAAAVLLAGMALAEEPQTAPVPEIAGPVLGPVSTVHSLPVGNRAISYTATFAERELRSPQGRPLATISATAYVRTPVVPERPVLFAFNGGPGASSSPLHFGAFGPRVIEKGPDGGRHISDNPHSPLSDADLVFIDPVGTGFSRVLPGGDGQPYWSVSGDATIVLDLIRSWLRENGRTNAPVYIAGESYGGFRLATLVKDAGDLPLAGLILISPLLDASASAQVPGNDLPFIFGLPSMAVVAWKQGRSDIRAADPGAVFEAAAHFARSDYALALLQGSSLVSSERDRIAARMSALIGLPARTIAEADLRVSNDLFVDKLLADKGLLVGRLDGRVTAPAPKAPPAGRPAAANDPSLGLGRTNVITSSLAADYFRNELGVSADRDYVAVTLDVNFRWDYRSSEQTRQFYVNPTPNIAGIMKQKPGLRVLLVGGYYDLAVPLLAARYAIDRAGIPRDRVSVAAFDAGHSPFEGQANRARMQAMLRGFFTGH